MIGRRIHQYEIRERLGGGGMGVVYKAMDTTLGRNVAIKFLSDDVADEAAKRRFMHEARVASSLDHPNICTIHEIEEDDEGRLFIVMAYYDGQALNYELRRGGLPTQRAVGIARQVTAGLVAAHAAGVLHRDIKPANVMLTEAGQVKIVDFGLAKIIEASGISSSRRMGTPFYMSPEQLRGDAIDERSDLWSLGVVLYEMVTGRVPFSRLGAQISAVMHSILHDEPRPLRHHKAGVPSALESVLARLLAKSSWQRYESAADLQHDLDGVLDEISVKGRGGAPVKPERVRTSLLVVPLATDDADQAYLADGISASLIASLSGLADLRVLAEASAFSLVDSGRDPLLAARELDYRYLLQGTVRRQESSLGISVRLLEVRENRLVWGERISGAFDDLFGVIERLLAQIVAAIGLHVTSGEAKRLRVRAVPDVRAYDLYLRARHLSRRGDLGSDEDRRQALEALHAAARVSDCAAIHAAIGQVHRDTPENELVAAATSSDRAIDYADRALSLDPESRHGARLAGLARLDRGEMEVGIRWLNQAIVGAPSDVETLAALAYGYGLVGRSAIGESVAARVRWLDPLNPQSLLLEGRVKMLAGAFADAADSLARRDEASIDAAEIAFEQGRALAMAGERDRAAGVLRAIGEEHGGSPHAQLAAVLAAALSGGVVDPMPPGSFEARLPRSFPAGALTAWALAQAFTGIGDLETALGWVERAVAAGLLNYPLLAEKDPLLEPLRSQARFIAVLEPLEERWKAFDAGPLSTDLLATQISDSFSSSSF